MCKLTDKAQRLRLLSHSQDFTLECENAHTAGGKREGEGRVHGNATLVWSVKHNRIKLVWSGHYFSQGQMHTYPAVKLSVLVQTLRCLPDPSQAFAFLLALTSNHLTNGWMNVWMWSARDVKIGKCIFTTCELFFFSTHSHCELILFFFSPDCKNKISKMTKKNPPSCN